MPKEEIMSKIFELRESFELPLQEADIDKNANIIRNVCLLSAISINDREYQSYALEKAVPLFEGAKVFANHAKKNERGEVRDVRDLIGKAQNVHFQEGKLKADLMILESQKGWVFPLAEQTPELVGLSINAQGKVRRSNSKDIVEEIVQVRSVDMVSEPAATSNLFEEIEQTENKEENKMLDFKEITLKGLQEHRPDIVKDITESMLKKLKEDGEIKTLQENLDKSKKELEEQKKKNDEYQVKEALQKKAELRDKLLKEAKLPQFAISEDFKKQLLVVEEETVDGKKQTIEEGMRKLIEDRKTVALAGSGDIKGMGDEKNEDAENGISDEQISEAIKGSESGSNLITRHDEKF